MGILLWWRVIQGVIFFCFLVVLFAFGIIFYFLSATTMLSFILSFHITVVDRTILVRTIYWSSHKLLAEFANSHNYWDFFAQFTGVRTNYWQFAQITGSSHKLRQGSHKLLAMFREFAQFTRTFSHNLLEFAQITGSSHNLPAEFALSPQIRTIYWSLHNLLANFAQSSRILTAFEFASHLISWLPTSPRRSWQR